MCICRVHMQCPHAECLRRHPISECSPSTPDRRRRPGSAPGPPAPALRRLGPGPPPARSSSYSESSEQLPSIAPRWPYSESLGFKCATTWLASRRRVALRSSIAGVACRADGCLPSGGRARSESVSVSPQDEARYAARPASQSRHPLAGSGGLQVTTVDRP